MSTAIDTVPAGERFREAYLWTSDVLTSLRRALDSDGFVEMLPAILSERYEPGARHAIAVLGDRALPRVEERIGADGRHTVAVDGWRHYYLPVSHCVEKQLALEHVERVYCIAPCVRLLMDGEEETGRHLYTFFQAEIEWRTEDVEDAYAVTERLLSRFCDELTTRLERSGRLDDAARERLALLARVPYERLPFAAARGAVSHVGGHANPHAAGDLTHDEEDELSRRAPAPFWLVDYPDGVRDSLYRRTPAGTFATYDLVLPRGYGEVATGGLRPDSGPDILRQAHRFSADPHPYYAEWKARTRVQTGGIGFGVERLVRYCAGIRDVTALRVAHDQGPNARIGQPDAAWTLVPS